MLMKVNYVLLAIVIIERPVTKIHTCAISLRAKHNGKAGTPRSSATPRELIYARAPRQRGQALVR